MTGEVDAAREAAIETYQVLDGGPRPELQAMAELAARLAGVPTATIKLFTADQPHQVAAVGVTTGVSVRADALCDTVLRDGHPILLEDASLDDRFRGNSSLAGEVAAVRFHASHPVVTPGGVVIGTLCVTDVEPHPIAADLGSSLQLLAERVVDLLELELTGRRLETAVAELSTSNERLATFAGQLSHDLKNPLAAVSMSVEMARDEVADEAGPTLESLLERAARGAERMSSMIGDLVAFARGAAPPDLQTVDLAEVMEAVLGELDDGAAGATVSVDSLPTVSGDPAQLRALLQHLVANAVKFTREGVPADVRVTARETAAGWRVEVSDNGIGVPAGERDRVFEPFVRLNKRLPGTGVGLSTCRRIVEAHGGMIGLAASPSDGALAWFELPA